MTRTLYIIAAVGLVYAVACFAAGVIIMCAQLQ